jgi:hypothetical protein
MWSMVVGWTGYRLLEGNYPDWSPLIKDIRIEITQRASK